MTPDLSSIFIYAFCICVLISINLIHFPPTFHTCISLGFAHPPPTALSCPPGPQPVCFSAQPVPLLLPRLTWTHNPLSSSMNISNYHSITQFKFSKSMSVQHLWQHLPQTPTCPLDPLHHLSVIQAQTYEHSPIPVLTLVLKEVTNSENSSLIVLETTDWPLPRS